MKTINSVDRASIADNKAIFVNATSTAKTENVESFDISVSRPGWHQIAVSFANAMKTDQIVKLTISDSVETTLSLPPTGSWSSEQSLILQAELEAGRHHFSFETGNKAATFIRKLSLDQSVAELVPADDAPDGLVLIQTLAAIAAVTGLDGLTSTSANAKPAGPNGSAVVSLDTDEAPTSASSETSTAARGALPSAASNANAGREEARGRSDAAADPAGAEAGSSVPQAELSLSTAPASGAPGQGSISGTSEPARVDALDSTDTPSDTTSDTVPNETEAPASDDQVLPTAPGPQEPTITTANNDPLITSDTDITVTESKEETALENEAVLEVTIVSENSGKTIAVLDAGVGALVYGDRDFTIDTLPGALTNAKLIQTNNDSSERVLTVENYVTFTASADGYAYIAYDSRIEAPAWLKAGWLLTGETVVTSEAQYGLRTFNLYGRAVSAGEEVVISGASGPSGGFSNLFAFVDEDDLLPAKAVSLTALDVLENIDGAIVADIELANFLTVPSLQDFALTGDDAELFEIAGNATDGFVLKLVADESLDFEAGTQPSVTISVADATSVSFVPTVSNDWTDDVPQGDIAVSIDSETSVRDIAVINAVVGAPVYGDRDYSLSVLPQGLGNARLIRTNNDAADRVSIAESYLTFTPDSDGYAYVAFDPRGTVPAWMASAWAPTGQTVNVREVFNGVESFRDYALYGREITAGEAVVLGGANGTATNYSNFFALVDDSNLIPEPQIGLTAIETIENVAGAVVADIAISNVFPAPEASDFVIEGDEAGLFQVVATAEGGFRLKLVDGVSLDFEEVTQPSVTVTIAGATTEAFAPVVTNDWTDDVPQGDISTTIDSETSVGDIAVINAGIGAPVYGDRAYTIFELPDAFANARLIQTNNDDADRVSTAQSYVTFMPDTDGFVYVAFDPRGTLPPWWLADGWTATGQTVTTREVFLGNESFPSYDLYAREMTAGEAIVLGGANGTATNYSNYFAFVDDSDLRPLPPEITLTAIDVIENEAGLAVADIELANFSDDPVTTEDFLIEGADAAFFVVTGNATDGFQLSLAADRALDFEADAQPEVTVSIAGASTSFTPSVTNDPSDDPVPAVTLSAIEVQENVAGIAIADIATENFFPAPQDPRDFGLSGPNADLFEVGGDTIDGFQLKLKEGVTLDFEAERPSVVISYSGTASDAFTPSVTDDIGDNVAPTLTLTAIEAAENVAGVEVASIRTVAFETVPNAGDFTLDGADAALFEVVGDATGGFRLKLVEGAELDFEADTQPIVTVSYDGVVTDAFSPVVANDASDDPNPEIALNAVSAQENVAGAVVADIVLTDIVPAPPAGDFVLTGTDADRFEVAGDAETGFQLKLKPSEALDFEADAQPSLTVSVGGAVSGSFTPSVSDDASDNPSIDATIVSENSYADIVVLDAALGVNVFGDRSYPITGLPDALANARLIQTNNGGPGTAPTEAEQDRFSTAQSGHVVFEVTQGGYAYVAFDARATTIPAWLQNDWTATGETVTINEVFLGTETERSFTVYGRAVAAGETVDLGGADRANSGAAISNYFAFVDDSNLGVPELSEQGLVLGNDSFTLPEDSINVPLAVELNDPENTTITSFTNPSHGTLQLIDGVLHYTPDKDYSNQETDGTDSFTYTVTDADGRTGEATVNLVVARSHEQPQANVDNWDLPSDGVNPVADVPLTDEQRERAREQMEDLVPEISPSGLNMVVSRFAKIPGEQASMLGWATVGDRMFVQVQDRAAPLDNNAIVYEMVRNDDGSVSVVEFFNIGQMFNQLPVNLAGSSSFSDGVRGFTFHPEFLEEGAEGYGKFYFTARVSREQGVNYDFMSVEPGHYGPDSAVVEFTYDFDAGAFDPASYREVTRIAMSVPWKHPIKDLMFNPYAEKGDADYGNLYFMMGDGRPNETSIRDGASQGNDAIGKVIRINPLETADGQPYSIPSDNPFVGNPDMIDEVFTIGLRNMHDISFYQGDDGQVHIILTGVGYDHADEVNIITPGSNLGWALRDGHWIPIQDGGNTTGLLPLPENEWELGLTYPATSIAHDPYGKGGIGNVGDVFQALAGGHVINNGSELDGQYIFADFAESSKVFHASIMEMLAAKKTLSEGEDPSALTWATPYELTLLYNHDNDQATTPIVLPSFKEIVNDYRSDVRFGEGPQGELYVMNKRDGWVYIVENSTPEGFQMPTGVSDVIDTPETQFLNARGDFLTVVKDGSVFLLDDGSNRGLMNNDSFPGNEPIIVSVNGEELTIRNSTGGLSGTFEGSNGGQFIVAEGGAVRFETNGDFAGLLAGENATSSMEYTIRTSDGATSTATVVVTVKGSAEDQPTIGDLQFDSGGPDYALGAIQVGQTVYGDRDYTIANFPNSLFNAQFIQTNNDDRDIDEASEVISFTLDAAGFVYVALDRRATSLPSWLDDPQWQAVEGQIVINGFEGAPEQYNLYGRKYQAGETISLGGNDRADTAAGSNYLVAVADLALFRPTDADTPAASLTLTPVEFDADSAGAIVATIAVVDPDTDYSPADFTLSGTNAAFFEVAVDADGSHVLKLQDGVSLNPEAQPSVTISLGRLSQEFTPQTDGGTVVDQDPPVIETGPDLGAAENSTTVGQIIASDADGDTLTYSLSGPDADKLSIDAATGVLSLLRPADFENPSDANQDGIFNVTVAVSDGKVTVTKAFTVTVENINEAPNTPLFNGSLSLSDNAAAGTVVGRITATDPDAGDDLTLSLDDDRFEIDETGLITVAEGAVFDQEAEGTIGVTVTVTDREGLISTRSLSLRITDPDGDGSVTTPVTFSAGAITGYGGQDRGANFSISEDGDTLSLNDNHWKRAALDGEYTITANTSITVDVAIGSNAPELVAIGFDANESPFDGDRSIYLLDGRHSQGAFVDQKGTGLDLGNGFARYTIDLSAHAGKTIGSLVFIADDDLPQARGVGSASFSNVALVERATVNSAPTVVGGGIADLAIAERSALEIDLPFVDADGDQLSFTVTAVDAQGRDATAQFANLSVDGFSLTGDLRAAPGSYTITVTANDGQANASTDFTLTVNDVNDAPVVQDVALEPYFFEAGSTISGIDLGEFAGFFSDPENDTLTFSVEGLPDGLTLNDEGVIVGTPVSGGDYAVTIVATDPGGLSARLDLSVNVEGSVVPDVYTVETEAFTGLADATNFYATGQVGASGDRIVRAASTNTPSSVTTDLSQNGLAEGWYTVSMTRYDETDGSARYTLSIGDTVLASNAAFDAGGAFDNGGARGNAGQAGNLKTLAFDTPVFVTAGTILTLSGQANGELLRTDKFTFTRTEAPNQAPSAVLLDSSVIAENEAGAVVGTLQSTDPDGEAVTFSVDPASDFEIADGQLKLKEGVSLDHEASETVDVLVTATDTAGNAASTTLSVTVGNVNEAPVLAASASIADIEIKVGSSQTIDLAAALGAIDPDAGASLTYVAQLADGSALPEGLSVEAGSLSMSEGLAAGSYEIVVFASDGELDSESVSFTLTVGASDTTDVTYEAEDAVITGNAVIVDEATADRNQSGAFVDFVGPNDETITWTVEVPTDGTYGLEILYALRQSQAGRPMSLSVDGTVVETLPFAPNSSEAEDVWGPQTASVTLSAGTHTISLTAPAGVGPNIDFLRLTDVPVAGDQTADAGGDLAIALVDGSDPSAVVVSIAGADDDLVSLTATFSDGTAVVSATPDGNGQFSVDLSALDGNVTVSLVVTDANDNTATVGSTFELGAEPVPNDGEIVVNGVTYVVYEAENAELDGPVVLDEDRTQSGSFVDFDGTTDQSITWTIDVASAGTYGLDFIYALASFKAGRPMTLTVDGEVVETLAFDPNSNDAESVWGPQSATLDLSAGTHKVTVTAPNANGPNIDFLRVTKEPASTGPTVPNDGEVLVDGVAYLVYEAENATFTGDPAIVDEDRTQSGSFVDFVGPDTETITFTVEVAEDGTYGVDFVYALGAGKAARPMALEVDGQTVDSLAFVANSNGSETVWGPQSAAVQLTAGVHTLTLTAPAGVAPNIDFMRISKEPASTFQPNYVSIDGDSRIELEATNGSAQTVNANEVAFYFSVDADGPYAFDVAANEGASGSGLTFLLNGVEVDRAAFPGTGEETVYAELEAGVSYKLIVRSENGGADALDYLDVRPTPVNSNADIVVDSQDAGYFEDRLHFQWIDNPGSRVPDNPREFKSSGVVEFSNSGTKTLDIIDAELSGPFKLADPSIFDGLSLEPGETIAVEVLFDRDAYNAGGDGDYGVFKGDLRLVTNDQDSPFATVDLAGFWQRQDEGGQEPNLNEVWDVFGFGNTIDGLSLFGGGENSVLQFFDLYLPVGETEVMSPYWRLADGVQQATITQIAALHQPNPAFISMFAPGNKDALEGLTFHSPDWSQGLLPQNFELTGFAQATFDRGRIPDGWAGNDVFGLQIDGISTDPTLNATGGRTPTQAQLDARYPGYRVDEEGVVTAPDGSVISYGYTVRMFQALNRDGSAIENVYLGTMDYTGINYDYNDNMFIIEGITPVGFGGELVVSGLDDAAADDRLVFTNIEFPDNRPGLPQVFRQEATFTIENDGFAAFRIADLSLSGSTASAFEIVSGPSIGDTIAAGSSVTVTLRFTGADGVDDNRAVLYNDAALTIRPDYGAAKTINLAGLAQLQSEAGEEPSVAQIVEALGYSTDMAQGELAGGGIVETVGDEVLAPYLTALDGSRPVEVIQIAAFLQQTNVARLSMHDLDSAELTQLFAADDQQGQTVLPHGLVIGQGSTGGVARSSFSPDGAFGLKITVDGRPTYASWTDPEINKIDPDFGQLVGDDQGHLIRFFQAKDAQGNDIPGTLIAIQDYPGAGNYDYNDHMFVIKNVQAYDLADAEDTNGDGVNDALQFDADDDSTVNFFDADYVGAGDDRGDYVFGVNFGGGAIANDPVLGVALVGQDDPRVNLTGAVNPAPGVDAPSNPNGANAAPGSAFQTYEDGTDWTANISVPNGTYVVVLHTQETYWSAPGQRRFDVSVNGQQVADDLDPFAVAGGDNPVAIEAVVTVTNGTISINMNSTAPDGLDNAPLSAVTIYRQASDDGQAPFGGQPHLVDADGVTVDSSNYDEGGQGVAYNDASGLQGGTNGGRAGSDVEQTAAGDIGWIANGEWLEYTIEVPADGEYDLSMLMSNGFGGTQSAIATFYRGGEAEAYASSGAVSNPSTGSWTNFVARDASSVSLEAGVQVVRFTFTELQDFRSFTITPAGDGQAPFGGMAPGFTDGSLTVDASDFDQGGQGVAYNDNPGRDGGTAFRPDVGVEFVGDQNDIGYVKPGEWVEYTIDVPEDGSYAFSVNAKTPVSGAVIALSLGGGATLGTVALADGHPGGANFDSAFFQESDAITVDLPAGQQTLRLTFDGPLAANGYVLDLRAFTLEEAGPAQTAHNGPHVVDADGLLLDASDYDDGGQGIAFNDAAGLQGGTNGGRAGSSVEQTAAGDIGWISNGEWLEYTIDVEEAGFYDISFLTSRGESGGTQRSITATFEKGGSVYATAPVVDVDPTGSWSNFVETDTAQVQLEAGTQVLRLNLNGGSFDLRSIEIDPVEAAMASMAVDSEDAPQAPVAFANGFDL